MNTADKPITELLADINGGSSRAADELFDRVYAELRGRADFYLRSERRDHTLQATALVHEAYLRLLGSDTGNWQDRRHFFNIAAQVMRNILVDHARKYRAGKRGEGRKLSLDEAVNFYEERDLDLVALDAALAELETLDPDQSRIVSLKFFGGLRIGEIAELLDVSEATVNREWRKAKMWLRSQLAPTDDK